MSTFAPHITSNNVAYGQMLHIFNAYILTSGFEADREQTSEIVKKFLTQ